MTTDYENTLSNLPESEIKSPLFAFLNLVELDLIRKNSITVLFKKGETIRKQGTFMSHVISMNSGLAKLYLEGVENKNAIIRIVKPPNFVGGPGIYLDQLHHFSMTALMNSSICFIDIPVFKEIIDTNKIFAHEFMKDAARNILSVYNRLISLTQKQMPGRMADTLIYLFDEIFESSRFILVVSKQDMAELSGMSKESAVKILKEFQNEGIISIDSKELKLLDAEGLRRISKVG